MWATVDASATFIATKKRAPGCYRVLAFPNDLFAKQRLIVIKFFKHTGVFFIQGGNNDDHH